MSGKRRTCAAAAAARRRRGAGGAALANLHLRSVARVGAGPTAGCRRLAAVVPIARDKTEASALRSRPSDDRACRRNAVQTTKAPACCGFQCLGGREMRAPLYWHCADPRTLPTLLHTHTSPRRPLRALASQGMPAAACQPSQGLPAAREVPSSTKVRHSIRAPSCAAAHRPPAAPAAHPPPPLLPDRYAGAAGACHAAAQLRGGQVAAHSRQDGQAQAERRAEGQPEDVRRARARHQWPASLPMCLQALRAGLC